MPSRGSSLAVWLLLAFLTAPAPACAVAVEVPLTAAGAQGFALQGAYQGVLGTTGLRVRVMPTMWLVTGLEPGGAAALVGMPDPRGCRLRLAAIDAHPIEDLSVREVLDACRAERSRVTLTLGCKRPGLEETYMGPFELPLSATGLSEARLEVGARAARLSPGGAGKSAERLLLEAQQARDAGDGDLARRLLAGISSPDDRERIARLRAELDELRAADALRLADVAAAGGQFEQARRLLKGVQPVGSWASVRRAREAEWRAALAARRAWAADRARIVAARKAAEAARKAEDKASDKRRRLKL